jgi:outer membrane murein-binding lipoprotein Lpp
MQLDGIRKRNIELVAQVERLGHENEDLKQQVYEARTAGARGRRRS